MPTLTKIVTEAHSIKISTQLDVPRPKPGILEIALVAKFVWDQDQRHDRIGELEFVGRSWNVWP